MPRIHVTIPEDMTVCHIDLPRESSLVASLFRLPRTEVPMMIMQKPKVTKPELGESRGQLRLK